MRVTHAIWDVLTSNIEVDELVLLVSQGSFRKSWAKLLEELGLEHMGPQHGIRNAAAAGFVASGGGLEEAHRRGRWKTPAAFSRYTKVHTYAHQAPVGVAAECDDHGAPVLA